MLWTPMASKKNIKLVVSSDKSYFSITYFSSFLTLFHMLKIDHQCGKS